MAVQSFTLQNQGDTQLALVPTTPPSPPASGFIIFVDSTNSNKLTAMDSAGIKTVLAA